MRIATGLAIGIAVVSICAIALHIQRTVRVSKPEQMKPISAALGSTSATWSPGSDLHLDFYLCNNRSGPAHIDSRMSFPGNINLWVEFPDGTRSRATRMTAKISRPDREHLLTLPPGRLYGTRLAIPGNIPSIVPQLTKPRRGRHVFWVAYYTPGNPELGCKEMVLTSNKVSVMVE